MDVKQSFDEYWEEREIEKGKGYKQYKRWEYFMMPRVYPSGERFDPDASSMALKEEVENINTGARSVSGTWQYIGNEDVPTSGGGAGRVNSVRMDPNNFNRLFACAPAGGLWRSNNGGNTWSTSTDQLQHIGTSDVLIDPTNSNIMYLATGDGDGGDTYSLGVLKSTDGGGSWNETGLDWLYQHARRIYRLSMSPTNSNVIFAATSAGVYRTTDAGENWSNVEFGTFKDVKVHPTNPNIVYATGNAFFRSTDGGATFNQEANGIPTSGIKRIAIAVTEDEPDYVYLLCGRQSNSGFKGLYRSTNAGAQFSVRATSPNLLGWSTTGGDTGGQAWYDLAIAVDQFDADNVFVGGINIWNSTDGGLSWDISAHWYGGGGNPYVHSDIHALEFLNGQLFAGSDGGVFRRAVSINSYTDISDGLDIAQIYCLGTSKTDVNTIVTGWQDNGTNLTIGNGWDRVIGGDGMECLVDHTDESIIYGSLYNGSFYKSTNGGLSFTPFLNSSMGPVNTNGSWVTPFVMDPNDHDVMFIGKDNLYRTSNGGASWTTITTPSSDRLDEIALAPSSATRAYCSEGNSIYRWDGGTSVTDISDGLPNKHITYIAVSNVNRDHVWVTFSGFSSNYKVFKSVNGGDSWTNISNGLPNVPANTIVYENGSNGGLYVGTDIGVYYRNATYAEWEPFFYGMPNVIVSELEINYTNNNIYAATYGRGVWRSDLFTGVASTSTDAGISQVVSPHGEICDDEIVPVIRLQNYGTQVLTSATIRYNLNASSTVNYPWTGFLAGGQSTLVTLPTIQVEDGENLFAVSSVAPNGGVDFVGSNNNVEVSFSVATAESTIRIATDRYGSQTIWSLRDSDGNTVMTGGPYTDQTSNGSFQQPDINLCLATGCYEFTVIDTYGNGMCCNSGNGEYEILNESGVTVLQGGDGFSQSETVNFCVNTSEYCDGDADGDGLIGIDDFVLFNSVYGEVCANCPQDLDQDGFVGSDDFVIFNSMYGMPCAQSLFGQAGVVEPTPMDERELQLVLEQRDEQIHPELLATMKALNNGTFMSISPNPSAESRVRLNLSTGLQEGRASLELRDMRGRTLVKQNVDVAQDQQSFFFDFEREVSNGAYVIVLMSDEKVFEQKLIKK